MASPLIIQTVFCVTVTLLFTSRENEIRDFLTNYNIYEYIRLLNTYMADYRLVISKEIGKTVIYSRFSFLLNGSSWLLLISAYHNGVY